MVQLVIVTAIATGVVLYLLVQSLRPRPVGPKLPATAMVLPLPRTRAYSELAAAANQVVAQELDGTVVMVSHEAFQRLQVALDALEATGG